MSDEIAALERIVIDTCQQLEDHFDLRLDARGRTILRAYATALEALGRAQGGADVTRTVAPAIREAALREAGVITGADAEAIARELVEGTPDTPERRDLMRRADAIYARQKRSEP